MTHSRWMTATALVAALTLPIAAGAQVENKPAAPAAAPARPAAPAVHAAPPHIAAPRVAAPHIAAPQRAAMPHFSAPRRAAIPHTAPQRAAAPHVSPQRAAVPRVTPQREVQHVAPHVAAASHATTESRHRDRAIERNNAAAKQPNNATAAKTLAATPSAQLSPAAQRRADRVERRNEQRVLRTLPANQRAAKRKEFRQQRLNAQNNNPAQQNATVQSKATRSSAIAQRRNARRNGGNALTAQAARNGRFAARFANRSQAAQTAYARANGPVDPTAARRAWRHHHRAGFVAWYGPVFWPYAYSDVFDYAFWPNGYDEGYWDYAYDGFFDGLFWGEQGPPADYADAGPATGASSPTRVSVAGVEELCKQPGSGITAWPFADIERKVGLNAEQKTLLGDVRASADKAKAAFQTSCPNQAAFPLTPPGRLQAMSARLGATLQAVRTVKPALAAFYNSLSDEQKERFNELGPQTAGSKVAANASETTGTASPDANSCKQPKPGLANLPIEKIEDVIEPTDAQEGSLDALQDATERAVGILQAACPDATPLTPTGRLDATEKRLEAMVEAANTVKPALDGFYGSLSNEQKARFNRIGQELAKTEQ